MIEDAEPTVLAYIEYDETTGQAYAYVKCCFCGDVHSHGAGRVGALDLGNRLSHCVTHSPAGYNLVIGLATMPKRKPYRQRLRDLEAYDRARAVEASRRAMAYHGDRS